MRLKRDKRFKNSDDEKLRVAGDPEQLAADAEREIAYAAKKSGKRKGREMTPEEEEEKRKRMMFLQDLCKEIVDAEFTIPVIITGDPRWRQYLAQEKLESLAYRWNVFFQAWGIEMSGKISAAVALAIGHSTTFGEIYQKMKVEDAEKEAEKAA